MSEYSKLCVETFLKRQTQLYDEPVAADFQEAEEFLEDCMAVVVKSKKELKAYLEEAGVDTEGMSIDELCELAEVFALPDGSYLIVEL